MLEGRIWGFRFRFASRVSTDSDSDAWFGIMQVLDVRHMELFLTEEYQKGSCELESFISSQPVVPKPDASKLAAIPTQNVGRTNLGVPISICKPGGSHSYDFRQKEKHIGIMQVLDVRHMELFLTEEYQKGSCEKSKLLNERKGIDNYEMYSCDQACIQHSLS
ncbi:hypothetical protein LXL04_023586 [Taraxacum kok-saghyz]